MFTSILKNIITHNGISNLKNTVVMFVFAIELVSIFVDKEYY